MKIFTIVNVLKSKENVDNDDDDDDDGDDKLLLRNG